MSRSLLIGVVGPWMGSQSNQIKHFKSLKDIKLASLSLELDAIVIEGLKMTKTDLETLVAQNDIPILIKLQQKNEVNFKYKNVFYFKSHIDLENKIEQMIDQVLVTRQDRENKNLKKTLTILSQLNCDVIHSTQDLFISEIKKFFKTNMNLADTHWIEVDETSTKLPGILQIRQQITAQNINQSALLSDLDGCVMSLHSEDTFEIWSHISGALFVFLWMDQGDGVRQCLILDKLTSVSLAEAKLLFHHLSLSLQRRWLICLSVSEATEQVYKDSLTDLYNQRFLAEVLVKKIEENKRYKTPFSVLFIDIDHFKRVNDSLGHLVGSGVLTRMGSVLQNQIRTTDYAFRYGGDEFIIILSHTEGTDAENVAERIRDAIEHEKFIVNELEVRVTVSIGLAFYPFHAKSAEEIIRIADEAMYYGKNKSRNVVYKAS